MKYIQLITVILVSFIFSSESAKAYYFPMDKLIESKIYVYSCKEDPSETQYWKLTYNPTDSTFVTEAFDSRFFRFEFFQEKLTATGFQVEKFVTYIEQDKRGKPGKLVRKPIEKDVYLWKTDTPYMYSSTMIDEDYGEVIFSKTRTFAGKEKVTVNSKVYNALKFTAECKTELVATKENYKYNQITHYAKNIGMVRSEKQFEDRRNVILELSNILTLKEWNALKK
ncbi:MAG: hypothetical protein AB8B65_02985 [Kordia sp.]|uniref:TapB family protein n=1 Tax=Kordia sp. TaxID=1965332 RepID=UPI00385C2A3D